eukprot:scaffold35031_cov52-Phaeocystis_antarctica.AAC.2
MKAFVEGTSHTDPSYVPPEPRSVQIRSPIPAASTRSLCTQRKNGSTSLEERVSPGEICALCNATWPSAT